MSNAYVIEASDETAGVVVREGQRFRFLSSSPRFWTLDGEYYRNVKKLSFHIGPRVRIPKVIAPKAA